MRPLLPALVLLGATACAEVEPVDLGYRSTMERTTLGVVLHEDGLTGHAGMNSSNCPFETTDGTVTGDYALEGGEEDIQDQGMSHLGEKTVVVVKDEGIVLLDKTTGEYEVEEVELDASVLQARLDADGPVALTSDCDVVWSTGATASMPGCNQAFDVDYGTGRVAVASELETRLFDADGTLTAELPGASWVAWDSAVDQLVLARPESALVESYDASGTLIWSQTLQGEVTALGTAGAAEGVAVAIDIDGSAALLVLSADDGSLVQRTSLPEPAIDVVVSEDGAVVAFVTPTAVHFFDRL